MGPTDVRIASRAAERRRRRRLNRYAPYATIIAGLALGWSLMAHLLGFVGLSILEPEEIEAPRVQSRGTSEAEWITAEPLTPDELAAASAQRPLPQIPDRAQQPTPQTPQQVQEVAQEEQPQQPQEREQPEVPDLSRQAVTQQSRDPSVEPPPNAQYIAAENQRVEEETVARETSTRSNEALATPPPPDGELSDGERPTDDPSEEPQESASAQEEVVASNSSPASSLPNRPSGSGPSSTSTPAPSQFETVTVDDGFGTFSITRPRTPAPSGDPRERGESGDGRPRAPDLRVGFSEFEGIYGADDLAAQRAEIRAQREALAAASGSQRRQRMEQYHFAAENFVSSIRPGNQTALNAAASPYAAWIAEVHRKIHRQFAERFLPRISSNAGPLANEELYAELEFVVDARGRVLRVAITRTSGVSAFDLGAFNSIMDAQPLAVPPDAIHSGDGRVYIVWGFSRGPSQCHTMQARPFILPNPPPLVPMPGVTLDDPVRPARFANEGGAEPRTQSPSGGRTLGRGPRLGP